MSLEYGLVYLIIKTQQTIIEEADKYSTKKEKKNQYLNLKVSQHNKKNGLILNKTVLTIISRQEKSIFTT